MIGFAAVVFLLCLGFVGVVYFYIRITSLLAVLREEEKEILHY
jgi:hypothetical protein